MKRPLRILVELFSLPFVAVIIFSLFSSIASRDAIFLSPKSFVFMLVLAYVLAGIPSIIFVAVLEIAFTIGLSAKSWRAVFLASFLGLLSGCAVALVVAGGLNNQRGAFTVFPTLGMVSGAIVGLIVRRFAI
jgi:hypothetical protein